MSHLTVYPMTIEFLPLAVTPSDYPKPKLSMLPSCPCFSWSRIRQANIPSAFLDQSDFFVFGRYALVEALKRAGVGPGKAVFLPAYHCRTIVESVLHLGAEVRFYPMAANLKPDFVQAQALAVDGVVRAMLVTHYFGFPNALLEARRFCSEQGIALIEDCAHAFYGTHEGYVLGSLGDYALASAWKYLPLRDGAFLRDNTGQALATVRLNSAALKDEFKAAAGMVEQWARSVGAHVELPEINPAQLAAQVFSVASKLPTANQTEEIQFKSDHVAMAGLRVSRWLVAQADHARVVENRRSNYLYWLDGIAGIAGVTPLYSSLPDGVVPYAFPLLADSNGLTFHALRLTGIPIWRWEDVAKTDCPISQNYRLRLLQLPCHQDLSKADIDWMLNTLRQVLPFLGIR